MTPKRKVGSTSDWRACASNIKDMVTKSEQAPTDIVEISILVLLYQELKTLAGLVIRRLSRVVENVDIPRGSCLDEEVQTILKEGQDDETTKAST